MFKTTPLSKFNFVWMLYIYIHCIFCLLLCFATVRLFDSDFHVNRTFPFWNFLTNWNCFRHIFHLSKQPKDCDMLDMLKALLEGIFPFEIVFQHNVLSQGYRKFESEKRFYQFYPLCAVFTRYVFTLIFYFVTLFSFWLSYKIYGIIYCKRTEALCHPTQNA